MAKSKEQKKEIVKNLEEKLKKAKAVVFSDYLGLKVKDIEAIKKALHQEEGEFVVTKKTLLKLALEKAGYKDVDPKQFVGGLAVTFGFRDEVTSAKVLAKFAKDFPVIKFFGGLLENKFIEAAKVKELALVPSRQELLGKLVSSVNAPLYGLLAVLSGNLRNLIIILQNYGRKKGRASA